MEIKIDPEFSSLIPAISEEEKTDLEESLLSEGCRDALILWDDILLDGHNRFDICTRREIKFKTIGKTFDSRNQAKIWIIANQLGRRNLSREQKSYLLGTQYNLEKKDRGGDQKSKGQNVSLIQIAPKIAKEHHVNPKTVQRAGKFAQSVDKMTPQERRDVLSGKSGKTKKEIIELSQSKRSIKIKTGPPCMGMQYARLAILDLEKILPNDAERMQAFSCVKGWIYEQESQP